MTDTVAEEKLHFTRLAVDNSPALLAFIARRASRVELAPEILNDVLVVAWRRRASLPADPEAARMWMFGVARNCIRSADRASSRRRRHESTFDGFEDLAKAIVVARDDQWNDVRALVRALPPMYRELVILIHWDGFSIVEAANLLRISDSTARTRYSRARERLRAAMVGWAERAV